MTLRNAAPVRHSPFGLSDNLDSTNVLPGAMAQLTNLIPDPTTKNLWQCRPASISLTTFSGLSSPGFISASKVVGTKIYGMIASALNAGHDEPFAYDLVTGAFSAITGITAANTPISPATTGDWTPPTMDLIGTKLVVTHPGYTGSAGVYFGWFDVSDLTAITWNGGNTTANGLPAVPVAVKQFYNRAYFLVNPATGTPGAYFTDVLTLNITAGTQVITFGDNVKLTALGALALNNQLGGIIQSLIVFKGAANMYQVTGDAALTGNNALAVNSMNTATGTLAPNSICSTPRGLAFIAPDGMRVVDFKGNVSDPVGDAGQGVTTPFIYAVSPSRIAAACNANTYRVSVQNGYANASPNQEFWYNIPRGCWSGPHSFPCSQIQVYNNTFIIAPIGVTANLFQSDGAQNSTSTYVENGTQMTCTFTTSLLPNTQQMSENAMVETTINLGMPDAQQMACYALDESGAVINSVVLVSTVAAAVWGGFIWGAALWAGAANALAPRQLKWTTPVVFQRIAISATGNCSQNLRLGDVYLRYQQLGYLLQQDTHII